jgi:hypothetical protein
VVGRGSSDTASYVCAAPAAFFALPQSLAANSAVAQVGYAVHMPQVTPGIDSDTLQAINAPGDSGRPLGPDLVPEQQQPSRPCVYSPNLQPSVRRPVPPVTTN